MNTYKGKFLPKNLQKYKGDFHKITYRQSWELHFMQFLDRSPDVVKWNSEETIIQYWSTLDSKKRRYFMDFTCWFSDGSVYLFEIKPDSQTKIPKNPKRLTESTKSRYIQELYTYKTNIDKWTAAQEVCRQKGWHFKILTEYHLKKYFGMKL